ncbi:MAG: GntR family transcriptional regulator [Anaerolineae bacterium]
MRTPLPQVRQGRVLADWVTESLREAILNGYFEPGEKLDQDHIAAEFEVSRTPIREALRRLEAEGFVEVRPHYGVYIARPSAQDIQEIYDVRKLLEPEIVRRVVPSLPQHVLDRLEERLARAQAYLEAGDIARAFEADIFDETVRRLSPNRLLGDILSGLGNRIMMVRRFSEFQSRSHITESLADHQGILRAMQERDRERAAELMRAHLEKFEVRTLEFVRSNTRATMLAGGR